MTHNLRYVIMIMVK